MLTGAGCAGLVAIRRRCSIGEPEEPVVQVTDDVTKSITKSRDGFEATGSMNFAVPGSKVSGSKSLLGINVQIDPRRKSRTLDDREKVII